MLGKEIISDVSWCLDVVVINFGRLAVQRWIVNSHEVKDRVILVLLQTSYINCDVVIPVLHVHLVELRNC
jgi:hypothetical protein